MELSYTFLKMQVMLPRKYFCPLPCCTPPALELWTGQLKLFQESAGSLLIKGSVISPLPRGWISGSAHGQKGSRAQLWEVITCWAPAHAGRVSWQSWMRARVGPCAKIPSAECSVMSERLPIGWKDVGKQEQIYIYPAVCSLPEFCGWLLDLAGSLSPDWLRSRGESAGPSAEGASPC